jgi:hypothetical protein
VSGPTGGPPNLRVVVPPREEAPAFEPVVWISRHQNEKCAGCGEDLGKGRFVQVNEKDGVRCLRCCGYDDLAFLGAGDALLTRRARARSNRVVIVVRWSTTRKRNEREGILVERSALREALASVKAENRKLTKAAADRLRWIEAWLDED